MKMKKRVLSLFTAILMVMLDVINVPIVSSSDNIDSDISRTEYSDEGKLFYYISEETQVYHSKKRLKFSKTEISSFTEQINIIRENLKDHSNSFDVALTFDTMPDDPESLVMDLVNSALEHSGEPTEGDWLHYHINSLYCWYGISDNGDSSVTMDCYYTVDYNSTVEQVSEADEKADRIIEYLDLDGKSDREKIHEIYNYVCQNVDFDFERMNDDSTEIEHSAYAALCDRKAVCQGYALAIYNLMLKAGIDCRIVTGKLGDEAHAWNIVALDGKYYFLDATNDRYREDYDFYDHKDNFDLFLVSENELEGYALDESYKTDIFKKEYPLTERRDEGSNNRLFLETDNYTYSPSIDEIRIISYTGDGGDVVIPSTIDEVKVTSIGYASFNNCKNLTSVVIPDGVKTIGYSAFGSCDNLKSVTIPDSVTCICSSAFTNCLSLSSVIIPNSVTSIGYDVFFYCPSLTSVTLSDNVTTIACFGSCSSLTSIDIPYGVTVIDTGAFKDCSNLRSVTIPDTVTWIGFQAFENCTSLTSVTIPESVNSIAPNAFHGCSSLKSINVDDNNPIFCSIDGIIFDKEKTTLFKYPANSASTYTVPNGVTGIYDEAFEDCTKITSIILPKSVTRIGMLPFSNCTGLTDITVDKNNTCYSSVDGVLFDKEITKLISYPSGSANTNYIIPEGVKSIELFAFSGCVNLEIVTLPKSMTTVDDQSFYDCKSLTSIIIPEGVKSIGEHVFNYCENLTDVTIPNSVTNIGKGAFYMCQNLSNVHIPDSITSISDWTFGYCPRLISITIPESVTSIGDYAFYENSLDNVIIPESVNRIGESAFARNYFMTSITIPSSITKIENGTFYLCDGLSDVFYKGTVEQWNNITIENNNNFNDPLINATIHCTDGTINEKHTHSYICKVITKPTCTEPGLNTYTCECGETYTETIPATGHKYTAKTVAPTCTEKGYTLHTCSVCSDSHKDNEKLATGHKFTSKTVAPTCTEKGYNLHTCSVCGDSYKDNEKPALGHNFVKDKVVDQTTTSQGYTVYKCTRCGKTEKRDYTAKLPAQTKTDISKATATFSSTKVSYTGKSKMPKLTITYNGKTLVKGTDYKVSGKNCKNHGKATITITGIGNYTGTKTMYFYIVPQKPTITKATSTKAKKITLAWNKDSLADGYQIIVYSDKGCTKKVKSVVVKKNSTVKGTIAGFTSGKTYYVRMRAYKTIDGSKKTGGFSAVKTVKVK